MPWRKLALLALLLALLTACQPWAVDVAAPGGATVTLRRADLRALPSDEAPDNAVWLERALWEQGHALIEDLRITDAGGATRTFAWPVEAAWYEDDRLIIAGEALTPRAIEVTPPEHPAITAHITDLAPTAAAALGLPAPEAATGASLDAPPAERVLLLFLDGFGYVRYEEALAQGDIPTLASLAPPQVGLTVYPPCTTVASAALLTGAYPQGNGVIERGVRTTEAETLFDVATAAGLDVVAVEGYALAFNLRNADVQLSGDYDGNGFTGDNVRANALAVLADGMPDLLWVHFHDIDDAGHTYGPGTPEERAAIRLVDAAVGDILAATPPGTLVLIFADHGMHPVAEDGRLGNHGHLIPRDMLIPVFVEAW